MAVSTKRKNSLKSKSNSKTRKQFKKFRKTKKNVRKMKGGNQLNVYSFKVIECEGDDLQGFYPIFSHCIVYAESIDKARTFINDCNSYKLTGNLMGFVKGEKGYEGNDDIDISGFGSFNRNIKKLGIASNGAIEGIVDLDAPDNKVATRDKKVPTRNEINAKVALRAARKANTSNEPIPTNLFN